MKSSLAKLPSAVSKLVHIIFALLIVVPASAQMPGTVDPTFNPTDRGYGYGVSGYVGCAAIQADGKILIGGSFSLFGAQAYIARLTPDGGVDLTFNTGTGFDGYVASIAVRSDGKIVAGGYFTSFNGIARQRIAVLNADGSLDTSFDPGSAVAGGAVNSLALQSDNKIVVAGSFLSFNGTVANRIGRLNTNGSADGTFNPGTGFNAGDVASIKLQADGKIVAAGTFTQFNGATVGRIARLNADGSRDTGFVGSLDGPVNQLAIGPDGKIAVVGGFTKFLKRLNADGTVDATFNVGTGLNTWANAVTVQPDNKVIIGGGFTQYNGSNKSGLARININGSLDPSFGDATTYIYSLTIDQLGRVLYTGDFYGIRRQNATGEWDSTFPAINTGFNGPTYCTAVQPDGKILVGGDFTKVNGVTRNRIARLLPDGTLDLSFAPTTGFNNAVNSIVIQPDGKIIAGGKFTAYNGAPRGGIARILPDGVLDTGFGIGGGFSWDWDGVQTMILQPDGKIVVGGDILQYQNVTTRNLARLTTSGSLDASFTSGFALGTYSGVNELALDANGKILVAGGFNYYAGVARRHLVRVNGDGSIDATFVPGSNFNSALTAITIQGDGKILICYGSSWAGAYVQRLNTSGSIDNSFELGSADDTILDVVVEPSGTILLAGEFTIFKNANAKKIVRLNSNGSLSNGFNSTGAVVAPFDVESYFRSIRLDLDGRILVTGRFGSIASTGRNNLAMINGGAFGGGYVTLSKLMVSNFPATAITPSPAKTFTVSATGMSGPATVSLSNSSWELSANGTTWSPSLTLANSGSTLAGQPVTVHVRLKNKLAVDNQPSYAHVSSANSSTRSVFLFEGAQTITYIPLNTLSFQMGGAPYTLTSKSTSGLPVTHASNNPAVATISGNIITLTGAGTSLITSNAAGDVNYYPAPTISQTLTVQKGYQYISFLPFPTPHYCGTPLPIQAASNSGLPLTFTSDNPSWVTVSGSNVVALAGGYGANITAEQPGDANWHPAPPAFQWVNFQKGNPVITIDNTPITKNYGDPSFTISYSISPATASVTEWSSSPLGDVVDVTPGGVATVLNGGTIDLWAYHGGDGCFNSASSNIKQVTVNQIAQQVTFTPPPIQNCGDGVIVTASSNVGTPMQLSLQTGYGNFEDLGNNQFRILSNGYYRMATLPSRNYYGWYQDFTANLNPYPLSSINAVGNLTQCMYQAETVLMGIQPGPNMSGSFEAQWTRDGIDIPGETGAQLYTTTPGVYGVKVTQSGCQAPASNEITFMGYDCHDYILSPNPADTEVTFTFPYPTTTWTYVIISGNYWSLPYGTTTWSTLTGGWTPGLYTVVVSFGGHEVAKNLVIEH